MKVKQQNDFVLKLSFEEASELWGFLDKAGAATTDMFAVRELYADLGVML